jgi:uncharacterized protein with PQ loop repeat
MTLEKTIEIVGIISAVAMPLCNLPLILRIVKRKSSADISPAWVTGVWICVMGMLPSTLVSNEPVMRVYGIANAILFSGVFFTVLKFQKPPQ